MSILLLNSGSSSLKASLVERESGRNVWSGAADLSGHPHTLEFHPAEERPRREAIPGLDRPTATRRLIADALLSIRTSALPARPLAAVGHRIVHGGPFSESVLITPEVRTRILALSELAPLHNPPSLESLAIAEQELPGVPQVAVFDTAFHTTLPDAAQTYALPYEWAHDLGLRKYGFHGLSYAYCVPRAAQLLGQSVADLRMIVCHLGQGASVTAIDGGRSVETSMGFTPLDGLMMGTRCGSVDPGLLLHVLQHTPTTAAELEQILTRQSGLRGVSGISSDMREVLAAADRGDPRASLAIEMYCRRVRQTIGAYAVTLGRVDVLVFTAGIGEHAAEIRQWICAGLECLGLRLDDQVNAAASPDTVVSSPASTGAILVIATREDVTLLREVERVLSHGREMPGGGVVTGNAGTKGKARAAGGSGTRSS